VPSSVFYTSSKSVTGPKVDRSNNPDFSQLRCESSRLDTFHDWPATAARVVDAQELVLAGLFYTGHSDRVQCAFCRGFLRNWVRGDKPIDEHRKHFPDCPFVKSYDTGMNQKFEESTRIAAGLSSQSSYITTAANAANSPTAAQLTAASNLAGPILLAETSEPLPKEHSARHPVFSDINKRIESYRNKKVGMGQTVDGLTKAGFFHVGPADNVRCFWCDGGLKNWQPNDDPWTEHARWFPRCPFVQSQKDANFIQNAQAARNYVASHSYRTTANSTSTPFAASGGDEQYRVEAREVKARMDSTTVQTVLKMGYQRDIVRKVIERRLKSTGDDFPSTQSLLEAVFEFEDELLLNPGALDQTDTSKNISVSTSNTVAQSAAKMMMETSKQKSNAATGNAAEPLDAEAQQVLSENRQLREARTCKVCMDRDVDTVFLPCGHLVCCSNCSPELRNCAVCRSLIRGTVRIFLS
jgi:hypothetical protein